MKRTYYLAIAAVVLVALVIFSVLNYSVLLILYTKYFDPHNINVFFVTRHGKLIQNVSVSLFAFYPTPNGTVIKEIYQGFNLKFLSIPVSNLTWYAKEWLKTYNYTILIPNGTKVIKKHIKYNASLIIPSLIGFASYYVVNQSNGTITIYTQPFTVSVSPRNITHGIGKTVFNEFVNPIVKRVKINESKSSSPSNVVTLQQTTTTITTTVPKQIFYPYIDIFYYLENYWIYPDNSSSLGPLPLAMVYVTDQNGVDYGGDIWLSEGVESNSSISISFGITVAYGALNFRISGTSITLNTGSYYINQTVYFGRSVPYEPPWSYPYFAEIYTWGQVAIANYSVFVETYPPTSYNVLLYFITALEVVGENGHYVPLLYATNELPPYNVQSFFNSNNKYELVIYVSPATLEGSWGSFKMQSSTSQGILGGGIPIKPLLQYAYNVPGWVLNVVSPYVVITPFASETSGYALTISIATGSSNSYYVYLEEISIPYNISGSPYTIPVYYFYVNYTTS